MANECWYQMKVQGSLESVNEFITIINQEEHVELTGMPFIPGIYDVYCDGVELDENGNYTTSISGTCAWSIKSSMACYRQEKSKFSNLMIESGRLQLFIEAYSQEEDLGFEEHYLYCRGQEFFSECIDYYEQCLDDIETYDNLDDDIKEMCTEEEFTRAKTECEYLTIGGYEDWVFDDISNYTNNAA